MSRFYSECTLRLLDGIEIFYTDSGSPGSSDYTTLVVVHGTLFNGGSALPLHEHAHKHNLRTIICNRRDYRGSSQYTEEELAEIMAGSKIVQDHLAIQLAWFLEHFIKQEGIPKLSRDRKTGGFILMGWSFGNTTTMSLFADPTVVKGSLYETIEPYIMSLVLYDPPIVTMGYPRPSCKVYSPWTDPDHPTPEQSRENFRHYVSSYFDHPDIASGLLSGLDLTTKRTEHSTINRWTPEQHELYKDESALTHSELHLFAPPMQPIIKKQTQSVIFDETVVNVFFPNVHIFYFSGERTTWSCLWAYIESTRMYKEAVGSGLKVRPMEFQLVKGANHLMHYDFPDLLLRLALKGGRREYGVMAFSKV